MKTLTAFLVALAVAAIVAGPRPSAQQRTIEDFFRDFSAEWVRGNPNQPRALPLISRQTPRLVASLFWRAPRASDRYTARTMRHNEHKILVRRRIAVQAIATRYFTGEEQDRLERALTPLTAEWRRGRVRLAERGLRELRRFDRDRLTDQQRLSADLMEWQLDTIVRSAPYQDYTFSLEQFDGAHVSLVNTLTVVHPVQTEKDAANDLARLAQVSARMREAVAEARRLETNGVLPPRFILWSTISQMEQFIAPPPAQNPFVTTFEERLRAAQAISDTQRAAFAAEAAGIVESQVYPAWRTAGALLAAQAERATDDAGLWRFEKGAEADAHHLRRHTTTGLTADEVHQIGLREVARLETAMDAILRGMGRTEGSVNQRVAQLKKDLSYPEGEESRTAIMADIDQIIRDAEKRVAADFDRRPRAAVVARPFPRFREAAAAASYNAPPLDASRPGVFQIPLRPQYMTKFGLRSIVYHETIPGHHFQVALDLENDSQPRFRRVRLFGGIAALTEEWALYAERLAAESGWYDNDPEGLLGQLDFELFRARRLVVDTGLHAKRWTREQTIAYGIEGSEVERYVVNPGQACAYMIGQLKLLELRDKARQALGDRFSVKAFHNAVLGAGMLPLDMLERQVDAYIRATARP